MSGASTAYEPAVLVLEDGRRFTGRAFGARGTTVGEAVFNTGMTGYQETLTDPSYHRQVVVMTAPHIGNTGWNDEDDESSRIWVSGFVVRDPALRPSNWRSSRSLDDELAAQGVVGISGLDTRALTRHLRERGAMRAGIFSGADGELSAKEQLEVVAGSPQMTGSALAPEVSTAQPYVVPAVGDRRFTVAAVDLGLFDAVERLAPCAVEPLAQELGVSAAHLAHLADAMVTCGFLDQLEGRYELTETAERYLCTNGAASMAGLIRIAPGPHANWQDLAGAVRAARRRWQPGRRRCEAVARRPEAERC